MRKSFCDCHIVKFIPLVSNFIDTFFIFWYNLTRLDEAVVMALIDGAMMHQDCVEFVQIVWLALRLRILGFPDWTIPTWLLRQYKAVSVLQNLIKI